ncbi:MAG: hypothetical protein KGJ98_12625 [Chloroflexota bacterium]|nr:hypothetical protein [Chloroflexota bacterium]MDE3103066.1 hypothetical protein [Chloroflexota bacterium]
MPSRREHAHFATNWSRSPLPVPQRTLVAARNLALRVIRRDTCCGHEGEPGC